MTGDDLRTAIIEACPLTNPRLSEVDWDAVAAATSSPEAPANLDYESEWYRKGWQQGYLAGRKDGTAATLGLPAAAPSPDALDVERVADDVRYAEGNGTSDYWRGFNEGIDRLVARLQQDSSA